MTYYLLLPGDTKANLDFETNTLGEDSGFGVFWGARGLSILFKISKEKPTLLPDITIVNDRGTHFTLEQFLAVIDRLEVRLN